MCLAGGRRRRFNEGDAFVTVKLEDCNSFVRGNFNPYIINPQWLSRQHIWRPDAAEFMLGVLGNGVRFRGGDIEWVVDGDRLVISSVRVDCGELAAKVLESLPHTPVRAVGSNFTFVGEKDDWGESPLPMLGAKGPDAFPEEQRPAEVRWSGTFLATDHREEITLVVGNDGVAVRVNVHRPASHAEQAALAARQFMHDKAAASDRIRHLLNHEVQEIGP